MKVFYKDADKDGYGNITDSIHAFAKPQNYVINSLDCNDKNANVNPGATEVCDGLDNNCDGRTDENKPNAAITALGSLDIGRREDP